VMKRRELEVHEDAWVLVHTGGNDILSNHPHQIFRMVWAAISRLLCCGLPFCSGPMPIIDQVAHNVQALLSRLHTTLGIKNAILVGMPLTASLPMVEHTVRLLLGDNACVGATGAYILRQINAVHIAELRKMRPDCSQHTYQGGMGLEPPASNARAADFKVVCLDEAAAVDAITAAEPSEHEGELVGLGSYDALWQDPVHPSQLCHEALSNVFVERFRQELEQNHSGHTGRESTEASRLTRPILSKVLATR